MTALPDPTDALPPSTRDRLLAAAVEVFRSQGYDGAKVQDIARAAGLTTGAIYANFRGKGDLLVEALARHTRAELDVFLRAAPRAPADLLHQLGNRLSQPRPGVGRPLLIDAVVAAQRDPDLAAMLRDNLAEREARFATLAKAAQRDGTIDPDVNSDAFARFSLMLAMGAVVLRASGVDAADADAWGDLIDRLLEALAPNTETTT